MAVSPNSATPLSEKITNGIRLPRRFLLRYLSYFFQSTWQATFPKDMHRTEAARHRSALNRPGSAVDSVRRGLACLGPKEGQLVRIVLNLLVYTHSGRVAAGQAVVQQNGPAAGGGRLK